MAEEYRPYEYESQRLEGALYAQEPEREPPAKTLCLVPALPAGYFISFLVALEGALLLVNIYAFDNTMQSPFLLDTLEDGHNPYVGVLKGLLYALAYGDVSLAALAFLGLYLASQALPRGLGVPPRVQMAIPGPALGLLLAWRLLVAVVSAPWVGTWLAFAPPGYDRLGCILVAIANILVNACLAWSLVPVVAAAAHECHLTQAREAEAAEDERQALLSRGPGYPDALLEQRPSLFLCLPLEFTVAAWALFLCIGSLWCFIRLVSDWHSLGGWAMFSAVPKTVAETQVLEVVTLVFTFIFSLLAVGTILVYPRGDDFQWEGEADQDDVYRARQRCARCLLAYIVASALRFALFIPATVMTLFAEDVCGIYSRGFTQLLTGVTEYRAGAPTFCGRDWRAIVTTVVAFFVDAYLMVGTIRLWRRYRAEQLVAKQGKARLGPLPPFEFQYEGYGAAPASSFVAAAGR